jgi:hypothetical protein
MAKVTTKPRRNKPLTNEQSPARQEVVDLVPLQREIQRVFDAVRDAIDRELTNTHVGQQPVILPTGHVVVNIDSINGSRARRETTLGHFAPSSWNANGAVVHQIALSPYYLNRPPVDTVATFVHEYLHNVAMSSGIEDTSRQGRFHNWRFGCLVSLTKLLDKDERSPKIGVTTKASQALITWVNEELQPNFGDVSKILEAPGQKKPPTTVKFQCDCGTKATVSVKQAREGFRPLCEFNHPTEPMVIVAT